MAIASIYQHVPDRRFAGQGFLVVGPPAGTALRAGLTAARQGALVLACTGNGDEACLYLQTSVRPDDATVASDRLFVASGRLSSKDDTDRLIEQALVCLPTLDAVVQEHAVSSPDAGKLLVNISTADWAEVPVQPLRSAFLLSQSVVQAWLSLGQGGRIVHVVQACRYSNAGQAGMQTALKSFVRSLGMEYGRRSISCNAAIVAELESTDALAVETILFLASSEASFVTADVFHVQ